MDYFTVLSSLPTQSPLLQLLIFGKVTLLLSSLLALSLMVWSLVAALSNSHLKNAGLVVVTPSMQALTARLRSRRLRLPDSSTLTALPTLTDLMAVESDADLIHYIDDDGNIHAYRRKSRAE